MHLVAQDGTGPVLLFLHGLARRWQTFLPLFTTLPGDWNLQALDFRGHGRSERGKRYLVSDYLQDVVELVTQRFDSPVVLYGHSLGALVSALVTAHKPEQIQAVILEDPPSPAFLNHLDQTLYYPIFQTMQTVAGRSEELAVLAKQLAEADLGMVNGRSVKFGEIRDPLSLRFSARCLREVDPAVFDPILAKHWLDGLDFWSAMRGIRCPVLLLHGEVDSGGMLPREDVTGLLQSIPDITPCSFKGAGHVLHWQEPTTVAKNVIAFWESL